MEHSQHLGESDLGVPRLGVGAMTWGAARGMARLYPAKMAYGGAHGYEEERRALEVSLEAGVNLFDTAAMYSAGASERRLGELAVGRDVVIATKFPGSFRFRAEDFPAELEKSLARLNCPSIDLYQHHYPSRRISIPKLMDQLADAVEAGKVKAVGVSRAAMIPDRNDHVVLRRVFARDELEYLCRITPPFKKHCPETVRYRLGLTLRHRAVFEDVLQDLRRFHLAANLF